MLPSSSSFCLLAMYLTFQRSERLQGCHCSQEDTPLSPSLLGYRGGGCAPKACWSPRVQEMGHPACNMSCSPVARGPMVCSRHLSHAGHCSGPCCWVPHSGAAAPRASCESPTSPGVAGCSALRGYRADGLASSPATLGSFLVPFHTARSLGD